MIPPRDIAERYRLEKILKSSRAGNVLRATDMRTGEAVVVKLLTPGLPPGEELDAALARFLRLAEGLAGISHPALPEVRDSGLTLDGDVFLVTGLLAGRGFDALAGGPPRRLLGLLAEVVDGLRALAARGLSHGNLSPDNLLVTEAGGIRMLGLGTAALRGTVPVDSPTLRFRAPEELAGPAAGATEGWRADLYSLTRIACQAVGVEVTFAESPEPRVAIPIGLGFLLADAETLRRALEAGLRRRGEDRPSLERTATALRQAIGAPEPAPVSPAAAPVEETRPAFAPPGEVTRPGHAPDSAAGTSPGGVSTTVSPAPASGSRVPEAARTAETVAPGAAGKAAPNRTGATETSGAAPGSLVAATSVEPSAGEEAPPALPDVDVLLVAAAEEPPPPKVAAPLATALAGPAAQEGKPTAPGWRRWLRPVPLAAAAAGLVLLVTGGLWLAGRGEPPAPTATSHAAIPPPAPVDPPAVRLAAARDALAAGDDHRALTLLRSLTPAEQSELPPESCELLRHLEETLAATAGERLASDLDRGFATGSLALLRFAVSAAEDEPRLLAGQPAEALTRLQRARQAVAVHREAEDASRRGDVPGALDRFAALAALVPDLRDEDGLRERAAAALEAEADKLVSAARYDEAIARLAPLSRAWPDRPGLARRLATYRDQQRTEAKVEAALASAATAEKRKQPDEGLALLRAIRPTPHLEAPYRDAQARLQAQLDRLDGRPPEVVLRDGYALDFDRGTVANVSVRVRDDYKVESVKFYARVEGARKMIEIPYERSGFAYTVEIAPNFHRNENVELYVVATDVSGHKSSLGSADKPLQLKRKRSFREG